MTVVTAPDQAGATRGGLAEPGAARQEGQPGLPDRMVRYGIWVVVGMRMLGDRRFQAGVITAAVGAYALASLVKNNQARPVRRAAAWYTKAGASRELHRAEQALKPDKRKG
jgi:hypothetical protein